VASPTHFAHKKGSEWHLLNEQACRLERAYQKGSGPFDIDSFASPRGSPLRLRSLHELIKTDLELRWKANHPVILDAYLAHFPELGPAAHLDPSLIYEEYRVRNLFGDRSGLDVYRQRFPAQFDQLCQLLEEHPLPPAPSAHAGTPAVRADVPLALPPSDPLATPAVLPVSGSGDDILASRGYILGDLLGASPFGEVYRARAPSGAYVAVKLIRRRLSGYSRQDELQTLNQVHSLRHSNLLQTHAYWSLRDGLIIAMELADDSLQDRMSQCLESGQHGVPANELLTFFAEAAEALDFLHASKVMHGNIKPANLLRLGGHAKVAEFGLGRLLQGNAEEATEGEGALRFMAPECLANKVSIHSDQYSLAMTYAEARLCRGVIHGKSPKEFIHELREGKLDLKGLGEAEQQVVLKALARDPGRRYRSCRDFVQALSTAIGPAVPLTLRARRLLLVSWMTQAFVALLLLGIVLSRQAEPGRRLLAGFLADPGTNVVQVYGNQRYFQRILYPLAPADPLEFLLIPEQKGPKGQTISPFYIMRNKATSEQFKAMLDNPNMKELLERYSIHRPGPAGDWCTVRREWEKPGWFDRKRAKHPVTGITATEAECFAECLGGSLPTGLQWDAAGGRWSGKLYPCDREHWAPRSQFQDVCTYPADQSMFGVTDMSGNGYEWLRDAWPEGSGSVPLKDPSLFSRVQRRGNRPGDPLPFCFDVELPGGTRGPKPLMKDYGVAPDDTSFRVVLEINP
jgi:hypothetical protein